MKKYRKLYVYATALAIAVASTGCSLFDKAGTKTKKEESVSKDVFLPTDREEILSGNETGTYSAKELERGIINGDWAIETVNGKKAVGEEAPFLKFDPSAHKVYGNNGCNVINGNYTYNAADSTINFTDLISTMRLCNVANITDTEINLALDATRFYSWSRKDSLYYIYFYDADHQQVMVLMHQNFQFLNGTWRIASVDNTRVDNPEAKIVIDIDEGKIHGYTGCNTFNGTVETNMDGVNSISFQAFTKTKMGCPEGSIETPLMVALENADHARPVDPDTAYLIDAQDEVVIILERVKVL